MKIPPLTYTHQQEQKCKKLQANKASTYRKQQIQTKESLKQPREHNLQTYYGRSLAGGQPGRNRAGIFLRRGGPPKFFCGDPIHENYKQAKQVHARNNKDKPKTSLKQPQEHKKL